MVGLAGCSGDGDGGDGGDGGTGGDGGDSGTGGDGGDGGDGGTGDGGGDVNSLRGLVAKTLVTRDPHKVGDADTISLAVNAYDGLVTEGADGTIVGELAEDWRSEDDGQRIVFTLREGLKTHAGNDITAEDVVYSANRYMTVGTNFNSLWEGVLEPGDVSALSDREVEFDLARPYGPFISILILFFVVDSTLVMENEEDGEHGDRGDFGAAYLENSFAGTGPYVSTGFSQGEFYEFERFEDYWKEWGDDQFDEVRWDIVLESSTQRTMIKEGQADFSDIFLSPDAYSDMESSSAARVERNPTLQIYEKIFNTTKPPFDDRNVRKAFAHAADYDTAEELMNAEPAQGPVPIILPEHNEDIPVMDKDLDAAREALDAASYSVDEINEMEIQFVWISVAPIEEQLALSLLEGIQELGIESVELVSATWANWVDSAASPDTMPHMASLYHTGNYPSAEQYLFGKYHPDAAGNYNASNFYHEDDELISTIDEARTEPDTERRYELWKEAQELAFEAQPGIFLTNPPYFIGLNENLGWEYRGGTQGFQRRWYFMTRTGDGRAT
jgi:peptide/nickel transport system substrate-binding protein